MRAAAATVASCQFALRFIEPNTKVVSGAAIGAVRLNGIWIGESQRQCPGPRDGRQRLQSDPDQIIVDVDGGLPLMASHALLRLPRIPIQSPKPQTETPTTPGSGTAVSTAPKGLPLP